MDLQPLKLLFICLALTELTVSPADANYRSVPVEWRSLLERQTSHYVVQETNSSVWVFT